jgi:hypothetical protein
MAGDLFKSSYLTETKGACKLSRSWSEILFRIRNRNEQSNSGSYLLCEAACAGRQVMAWGSANFRPTDSHRELGGPPRQVPDVFCLKRRHFGLFQDLSVDRDAVTVRNISSGDRRDALAWDNHSHQVQRISG